MGRAPAFIAAILVAACAATPIERFPSAEGERVPNSRSELFVPEGAGRHPAVVLLHTCGGIGSHLNIWASRLVREKYVVLKVDSFGPRGAGIVCDNWTVGVDEVAADALAAAEHLRKLPFVDPSRVFAIGFSYGAMAGLRLASDSYVKRQKHPVAFRGIVAFYPSCRANLNAPPVIFEVNNNFYYDIATPLHLLLGGADAEASSAVCASHAEGLKLRGQPVTYTVFPGVTHAFDQEYRPKGYRYDVQAVETSWEETREFLARVGK